MKLHQSISSGDKNLLTGVIENNSSSSVNQPHDEPEEHLQSVTLCNPRAVEALLMQFTGRKNETSANSLQGRHVCSYCKKSFWVLGQLSNHLRLSHTGWRPVTCKTCNMAFVSKAHFDQHKLVHNDFPENSESQLQESNKQLGEFNSSASISEDRSCEANETTAKQKTTKVLYSRYRCSYCKKTFLASTQLRRHVQSNHRHRFLFTCKTCDRSFLNKRYLDQHMVAHRNTSADRTSPPLETIDAPAAMCGSDKNLLRRRRRRYVASANLLQHQHSCAYCEKTFVNLGNLRLHLMQYHANWQPFSCPECKMQFLTKRQLDRHVCAFSENSANQPQKSTKQSTKSSKSDKSRMHSGHTAVKYQYPCRFCELMFVHIGGLNYHLQHRHPFACMTCQTDFHNKTDCDQHTCVFGCTACKLSFRSKTDLDHHTCMFTASETNQPHKADRHSHDSAEKLTQVTGHESETSANSVPCTALGHLRWHERFYKRGRPFTCTACNKSFATPLHLERQTCSHREKGPFSCDICGKLFSQKRFMNMHALSHVYEPTETSDVCSQIEQSLTSDDLFESEVTESHVCDICKREFEDKRVFDTHVRLHSRLQTLYQRK